MTLEEKLKSASWTQDDGDCRRDTVLLLSDALSICQEAVDERNKKIVGLIDEMIKDGINPVRRFSSDAFNKTAFEALTELKEKL